MLDIDDYKKGMYINYDKMTYNVLSKDYNTFVIVITCSLTTHF